MTPGPLFVLKGESLIPGYDDVIVDENEDYLALVDSSKHRAGNAELFAAAPDLLEALEREAKHHPGVQHGRCKVCGHHGQDCTAHATRAALAAARPSHAPSHGATDDIGARRRRKKGE